MLFRFLLEITGLIFPSAMMYAITSHYSLDFLQPGLTVEVNRLYCCLLPMIVYSIARLYIFMTSRLVSKALSFIPNGNKAG